MSNDIVSQYHRTRSRRLQQRPAFRAGSIFGRTSGRGHDIHSRRKLFFEQLEDRRLLAVTIARTSDDVFYRDASDPSSPTANYVSYAITNTGPAAIDDLQVEIADFSGGSVQLAAKENSVSPLGSLGVGETKHAFFYLNSTAATAAAQSHTINAFDGSPVSGVLQGSQAFSLLAVESATSDAGNAISNLFGLPDPPELGGLVTLTATGQTGPVGGSLEHVFSPATHPAWPANRLELVSTSITMNGPQWGGTQTFTNQLAITAPTADSSTYLAAYTFRVAEMLTGETTASPMNFNTAAAGPTHTDSSNFSLLDTVAQPVNTTTIQSVTASPSPVPNGGTTQITVTFANSGSTVVWLDDISSTLPAGATVINGSSQFDGLSINDPSVSGQTLTWNDTADSPFPVPVGGTVEMQFSVQMPVAAGTYATSVIAHVGSSQIDATLPLNDNVPGSVSVTVSPSADVSIVKGAGPDPVLVGSDLTYTIRVENAGPSPAENVVVTDTLPPEVTLNFAGGGCVEGPSGTLTCSLGNLGVGPAEAKVITISVNVDGTLAEGDLLTNTATVAAATPDPNLGNNTATIETIVTTAQIINDFDNEFVITQGSWIRYDDCIGHYKDDATALPAGIGENVGQFQFTGLTPGFYRVSKTWLEQPDRASNTPFTIIGAGGDPVTNVLVDQRLSPAAFPNSFTSAGHIWMDLDPLFEITGTTLTVQLTDDADGWVVADAIRLEFLGNTGQNAPQLLMDDGDLGFAVTGDWTAFSGQGHANDVRFSDAGTGTAEATWTIDRLAPGDYRVWATWTEHPNRATNAQYVVNATPVAFTINQQNPPPTLIGTTRWQSLGDFAAVGDAIVVSLNDNANGYVIADAILIERLSGATPIPEGENRSHAVVADQIDNGESRFETTGRWTAYYREGFQGDVHFAAAGDGTSTARWDFGAVQAGVYRVWTTWTPHENRATNAPFTVNDYVAVSVNQRRDPSGPEVGGAPWQSIGDYLIDGTELTVTLRNVASGYVIADAVRIERIGPMPGGDPYPVNRWQNPTDPFDVDGRGGTTALDVLLVANELNTPAYLLPDSHFPAKRPIDGIVPFLDVSGDGMGTPLDAVQLINHINRTRGSSEGEAERHVGDRIESLLTIQEIDDTAPTVFFPVAVDSFGKRQTADRSDRQTIISQSGGVHVQTPQRFPWKRMELTMRSTPSASDDRPTKDGPLLDARPVDEIFARHDDWF